MKRTILSLTVTVILVLSSAFTATDGEKLISKSGHVNFFSHTAVEDISADNYKLVSTLEPETGTIVFSISMQSFQFDKSLMQKHFNSSKFLDTKVYPKSKFKGSIDNLSAINFTTDGTYNANISGNLTIHGVTKAINETAIITILQGKITIDTALNITLADYNIAFENGKPSTNIAKTVNAKIKAEYN